MKFAIFIIGEYRQFDIASKYWDFINYLDCDLYFSTWNKSHEKCLNLNIDVYQDINKEMILSKFPNAQVLVHDIDFFNKNNPCKSEHTNPDKMVFHYKECLNLYKKCKKLVDYIMIIRIDHIYHFNFNNFKNLKKNILYGDQLRKIEKGEWFIHDVFFLGCVTTMEKFITNIPIYVSTGPHQRIANTIIQNKIINKHFLVDGLVVRPNMISTFKKYEKIPNFFKYKEFQLKITKLYDEWANQF